MTIETTESLTDEYTEWLEYSFPQATKDSLPRDCQKSADELWHELQALIDDDTRAEIEPLCEWLQQFIARWEEAQAREDFESAIAARGEK